MAPQRGRKELTANLDRPVRGQHNNKLCFEWLHIHLRLIKNLKTAVGSLWNGGFHFLCQGWPLYKIKWRPEIVIWTSQKRNAEILFYSNDLRSTCREWFGELRHLAPSYPPRSLLWSLSLLQSSPALSSHPTFLPPNLSGKTSGHLPGFSSLSTVNPSYPFRLLITSQICPLLCCHHRQGHLLSLPKDFQVGS